MNILIVIAMHMQTIQILTFDHFMLLDQVRFQDLTAKKLFVCCTSYTMIFTGF